MDATMAPNEFRMAFLDNLIGSTGSHHDSTVFFKLEVGPGQNFRID